MYFLNNFLRALKRGFRDRDLQQWGLVAGTFAAAQSKSSPASTYCPPEGGEVPAPRSLSLGKQTPEIVKDVDKGTKTSQEAKSSVPSPQKPASA